MLSQSAKSREEVLAERQEKKKRKAALKNQPKERNQIPRKEIIEGDFEKADDSAVCSSTYSKDSEVLESQGRSPILLEGEKSSASDQKEIESQKNVTKNKENECKKNLKESLSTGGLGALKTKAELKAERRAKQEAERAKKLEKSQATSQEKKVIKSPAKLTVSMKMPVVMKAAPDVDHKVKLFAHLYDIGINKDSVDASPNKIHPSIIQLGAQYSSKVVSGANACCLALLNAFKKVVMDFETSPNQEFSRGLEAEITKSMAYLSNCRPVAVSMINAVKHLKFQVSQSRGHDLECKNNINEWIDIYIKEQLETAAKAICLFVREKITPGDVILTYGCSSLVEQILISVHNDGITFRVIVVDGRPWLEGREILKKLVSAGIHCTYIFVNGLSFIMPEVTKILLGAHALLANGYVMSRAGSSQIALLAKTYNVPVLVCCETHKFSERVQTDSFVYNELGNPDELALKKGCLSKELSKWKSIQFLTPLNLTYDVTPPDLVSAVITEIAVLPCTSVPVILRIKPPDVSY